MIELKQACTFLEQDKDSNGFVCNHPVEGPIWNTYFELDKNSAKVCERCKEKHNGEYPGQIETVESSLSYLPPQGEWVSVQSPEGKKLVDLFQKETLLYRQNIKVFDVYKDESEDYWNANKDNLIYHDTISRIIIFDYLSDKENTLASLRISKDEYLYISSKNSKILFDISAKNKPNYAIINFDEDGSKGNVMYFFRDINLFARDIVNQCNLYNEFIGGGNHNLCQEVKY